MSAGLQPAWKSAGILPAFTKFCRGRTFAGYKPAVVYAARMAAFISLLQK